MSTTSTAIQIATETQAAFGGEVETDTNARGEQIAYLAIGDRMLTIIDSGVTPGQVRYYTSEALPSRMGGVWQQVGGTDAMITADAMRQRATRWAAESARVVR